MLISPLSCCHNLACSTEKRRGVTCARPTTNLRWCCSGRPAVSNPARYAPRLKCCLDSWPLPCRFLSPFAFKPICIYIYPSKDLSRSGLAITIYHAGRNQRSLPLLVDDRCPLLPRFRIKLTKLDGHRLSTSGTCQLSATVSFCLRTHHVQTRPQVLRITKPANQECVVSGALP